MDVLLNNKHLLEVCSVGSVESLKFPFFDSDSFKDTSKTRSRSTLSDRHACRTLGEIAAQAATSGECELTKFAFSCIRFVDPSALQPYEGLSPKPKLTLIIDPERMIGLVGLRKHE